MDNLGAGTLKCHQILQLSFLPMEDLGMVRSITSPPHHTWSPRPHKRCAPTQCVPLTLRRIQKCTAKKGNYE